MTHKTILEVDEDGNYFITFSPEFLAEMGWGEGTTIQWIDNHDGSYSIAEVSPETPASSA